MQLMQSFWSRIRVLSQHCNATFLFCSTATRWQSIQMPAYSLINEPVESGQGPCSSSICFCIDQKHNGCLGLVTRTSNLCWLPIMYGCLNIQVLCQSSHTSTWQLDRVKNRSDLPFYYLFVW